MGRKKKKRQTVVYTCTPNCIYFQQDVPKDQVISIREENGVLIRTVRRDCLYDNSQIKSWGHLCGRGRPCLIRKEEAPHDDTTV